jgi:hypothetical protein
MDWIQLVIIVQAPSKWGCATVKVTNCYCVYTHKNYRYIKQQWIVVADCCDTSISVHSCSQKEDGITAENILFLA